MPKPVRFGACGPSYTSFSELADIQRTMNFYPEIIESGQGVSSMVLYPTPGLEFFLELPTGPVRAQFTIPVSFPGQDRTFVISGDHFYEVTYDENTEESGYIDHGYVGNDGFAAFMEYNRFHIAIVNAQQLYLFDVATNTLSGPIQDTDGNVLTPICLAYLDGFFLISIIDFVNPQSQKIHYCAPFDATTWDPLDFFEAEANPDNILGLLVDRKELWVFGDASVTIFATTQDPDNPFQPVPGGHITQGLAAPLSIAKLYDYIIWLGKDQERGGVTVWKADGYRAKRAANHAFANALAGIVRDYGMEAIVLSRAYVFQDEHEHQVYQISFPIARQTWRCDLLLPPEIAWYEVGCWDTRLNSFDAHHTITHTWAFGFHLVGDRGSECCGPRVSQPPDEPLIPPSDDVRSQLEDDVEFQWRKNSRVGPFINTTTGEMWAIGGDPNDSTRLIAPYSPSFGAWSIADDIFPSLANGIGSFDAHESGDYIHVATQENTTGRTAYHRFNKTTNEWDILNKEVKATNNIGSGNSDVTAAITIRSTGSIIVYYQSDFENIAAVDYWRGSYKESDDDGDTWSVEVNLGHTGLAVVDIPSRPIADNAGRVHFYFGNTNSPNFGHYYVQTLLANDSLTAVTQWHEGSGAFPVQIGRIVGDYCTFDGGARFVLTHRLENFAFYTVWTSGDAMTAPDVGLTSPTGGLTTFLAANSALCPQVSARHDGTNLHVMAHKFDNNVPTWFTHKQAPSPYTTFTPSGADTNQAGPRLDAGIPGQEMAATIVQFNGENYYAAFYNTGNNNFGLLFNLLRVSQLPTDTAHTMSTFIAGTPVNPDLPNIVSVTPDEGLQGNTIAITISGSNLTGGIVTISGSGVTVDDVVVEDDNTITANLIIDSGADADYRNLIVTTAEGPSNIVLFLVQELSEADNIGILYRMSQEYHTDDGCNIRRVRRATHSHANRGWLFVDRLTAHFEPGLATAETPDPQVMMRYSNNGGKTWTDYLSKSAGLVGAHDTQIDWINLGRYRDRVYEFVVTDPVPWKFVDAYVIPGDPGRSLGR